MLSTIKGRLEGLAMQTDFAKVLSPEYHQQEIDKIFRRAWLPIGHTTAIPQPGDFFVRELPGLNASLLVVRGRDGVVRAFHNVCRHRGFQLECAEKGRKRAFSCGFHGWMYDVQGALIGVTDEDQFQDLDKKAHSLVPVHAEVWETFIFVNLDKQPRWTLHEWLGEMADAYTGFFDRFGAAPLVRADVNCNWNLGINAFTENYHTLYLHKHTVPDYQGSPVNPLRHAPAMELLQRHGRYSCPNNPEHKQRFSEALAFRYTPPTIPTFISDCTGLPRGINFDRVDNWAFDVVELFPNFVFLTGHDWAVELWFWPNGNNKSVFEIATLMDAPRSFSQRIAQEFSNTQVREVGVEDLSTLERQDAMMRSGAAAVFPYSEQELMLAHHYRVAAEMMEVA